LQLRRQPASWHSLVWIAVTACIRRWAELYAPFTSRQYQSRPQILSGRVAVSAS